MDIKTFIAHMIKGDEKVLSSSVICFTGRVNQPVFFSRLIRNALFDASVINASSCDIAQAQGQLVSTFLGKMQFFWLSSFDELSAVVERRWL